MPPDEFTKEAARLWDQVKPLYGAAALLRARQAAEDLRRRARARRQADSGAAARQHVGAAVGARSIRWSSRIPACRISMSPARWRSRSTIRCSITQSAENFYVSLGFPKLPQTFWERSLLDEAARSRRAMSRERLAHGQQGGRAHQAVHRADAGTPDDRLSRARSRVLLPVVQGSAVPVPERRARRLPRSDRRHREPVDDAGLPAPDRSARPGEAQRAKRRSISR